MTPDLLSAVRAIRGLPECPTHLSLPEKQKNNCLVMLG